MKHEYHTSNSSDQFARQAAHYQAPHRKSPLLILAVVLSILAIVISLVSLGITIKTASSLNSSTDVETTTDDVATDESEANDTSDDTVTDESEADDTSDESEAAVTDAEWEGDSGNWHIKILDTVETGTDYDGNTMVMVSAEATNISDENDYPGSIKFSAFQDGVELSECIYSIGTSFEDEIDEARDVTTGSIQPGTTVTIAKFYTLDNTDSDINLEVQGSYADTDLPTITADLSLND